MVEILACAPENCIVRGIEAKADKLAPVVGCGVRTAAGNEAGGWPTFTVFVKVGTARSDVTAFLGRHD